MIRKAKTSDTDKILKIWLEASNQAHYFVEENYDQIMLIEQVVMVMVEL